MHPFQEKSFSTLLCLSCDIAFDTIPIVLYSTTEMKFVDAVTASGSVKFFPVVLISPETTR